MKASIETHSIFRFLKSEFLKNVSKLAAGSGVAQIIALACTPILTRLYDPDAFGLLGVFMAIATVATTTATLRYDLAIMLPKTDAAAWRLLWLAGKLSLIVLLVLLVLIYPFRKPLAGVLGTPELASYFVGLPLMVLVGGWVALASHWATRRKRFGVLSQSVVTGSVFGNAFKIGGGFLGLGGGFLILATFAHQAVQLIALALCLRKEVPSAACDSLPGRRILCKYKDFPRYRMPQDAIGAIAINLPQLLLAAYFSPAVVGFYLLAHRVTLAPISLVSEAVRNVFYQKATEIHHQQGDLRASVLKVTAALALLCLPLTLVLFFLGEALFMFIFGAEWALAGRYAKYIGILVLASVANTPSVVVVPILGKNLGLLIYEVFGTGIRLSAIVIGGVYWTAEMTVAAFCLASAFANVCLMIWVFRSIKKTPPIAMPF